MTDWKERLLAAVMAGGTAGACTLMKEGATMNQAPDPCFSTPDPAQCSYDRAAGRCAHVPDKCCGQPNSLICANNACVAGSQLTSFSECCTAPDPVACAIPKCAGQSADLPGCSTRDGGLGDGSRADAQFASDGAASDGAGPGDAPDASSE